MPNNNILALDTTLPHASLWLRIDGKEIFREAPTPTGAAEIIFSWLKELLIEYPSLFEKIDCYGLNIGPGRFNGVRLGFSIIGTLCVLHPKKIYTVTTFDLLRSAAHNPNITTYAVYAKKGHAYTQKGLLEPELLPYSALDTEGLCTLQCPEVPANIAYNFIPISEMGKIINEKKAEAHLNFSTVVPVYSALI